MCDFICYMCVCVWVCVASRVGKEAETQTNLWSVLEDGAISWYTQRDKDLDKLRQREREKSGCFFFLFFLLSEEMLWASLIGKGSLSLAVLRLLSISLYVS